MSRPVTRRGFLVSIGVGAAAIACSDDDGGSGSAGGDGNGGSPSTSTTTAPPAPALSGDPFTLGVASGDPMADRVVLWTRLAPTPLDGGGMPDEPVTVVWEVATDDGFESIVRSGTATAETAYAHSVHVDVDELDADSWYQYRFRVGEWTSPVGRTRTTPPDDVEPAELRFGFASCQDYQDGYYNAYRDMAATELDLVLFLGDYIYEYGPNEGGVRQHNSPEVTDLPAYRNRYALYKSDPNLQAAHAHCPWVVVWDDHEVENNYAADRSEDASVPPATFLERRAAAYLAWWEHMPVRMDPPDGSDLEIYRRLDYGKLASLFMLDTRQYRSLQACDGATLSLEPACDEVREPDRTFTGDEQAAWLTRGLSESEATWNVIGNQTVMSRLTLGEAILNFDQWDGYPVTRQELFDVLESEGITNTVVVTGDIHLAGVGDVGPEGGAVLATELVGTSISSTAGAIPPGVGDLVTENLPHVKYFNADQRGWCHNVVTPTGWTAEFRVVEDNRVDGSPTTVDATFTITPDQPGAVPA